MTEKAVVLLNGNTGLYGELTSNVSNLKIGTSFEDSNWDVQANAAVLNHFYDPQTGLPLTMPGWSFLSTVILDDAVFRGSKRFSDAVTQYKSGNKIAAYNLLGGAAHLLTQDLSQPAHTHNDPHIPVNNIFPDSFLGLNGSDDSPLEQGAENYCLNYPALFPDGTSVQQGSPGIYFQPPILPGPAVLKAGDFGVTVARATYQKAAFQGGLGNSGFDGNSYYGSGAVQITGGPTLTAKYVGPDPSADLLDNCRLDPHWTIQGKNENLCYDPTVAYDGTAFSHFTNDWWRIPTSDSDIWKPFPVGIPYFYFDHYDEIPVGATDLNQIFIQTLVPQAINYTAGLLQLFANKVDPIPPIAQIRTKDSNGKIIRGGDYSNASIFVHANDPSGTDAGGDSNYPTASGIFGMALKNLDTGTLTQAIPSISTSGENPAERTFENLSDGHYELEIIDGLGNINLSSFTVAAPLIAYLDQDSRQFAYYDPYNRPTSGKNISISVEDIVGTNETIGGGLARLDILSSSGAVLATNSTQFPLEHVYTSKDDGLSILAQLPPDTLTVVATDLAGSTTTAQIFVDTQAFAVLDSSGIVVPDAGATSSGTVTLHGDANTYTLLLDGPTAFDPLVFTSTDPPLGDYDGLAEGVYTASALDINNVLISSQTFVVDFTPPVVTAAGGDGLAIAPGGSTNASILKLTVSDPLSGAAEIDVPSFDPYFLTGDTTPVTVEFDGILSDSNTVTVYDRAGNASVFNFVGANHLPVVVLVSSSGHMNFDGVSGTPPAGSDISPGAYSFSALDPTGGSLSNFTTNARVGGTCSLAPESTCTLYADAPGVYTVSVSNSFGTSSVQWNAQPLSMTISSAAAGVVVFDGTYFKASPSFVLQAPLQVQSIASFEESNPLAVDRRASPAYASSDFPDLVQFTSAPYYRDYFLTDDAGNQVQTFTANKTVFAVVSTAAFFVNNTAYTDSTAVQVTGPGVYSGDALINLSTNGVVMDVQFSTAGRTQPGYALLSADWTDSRSGEVDSGLKSVYGQNIIGVSNFAGSSDTAARYDFGDFISVANLPIVSYARIGTEELSVDGNKVAKVAFAVDDAGEVVVDGAPTIYPVKIAPTDPSAYHLHYTLTLAPQGVPMRLCFAIPDGNPGTCQQGSIPIPLGFMPHLVLAQSSVDQTVASGSTGMGTTVVPGAAQTVIVAPGATISGLNVAANGGFAFAPIYYHSANIPYGYADANGGTEYQLASAGTNARFWNGTFTLTVPFHATLPPGVDSGRIRGLYAGSYQSGTGTLGAWQTVPVTVSGNSASIVVPGPGIVAFAAPNHVYANTAKLAGLTIQSDQPVSLVAASSDTRATQALSVLAARGLVPNGRPVVAGPSGQVFSPAALVTFTPDSPLANGLYSQVSLADARDTHPFAMTYDPVTNTYSGFVSQLHSMFGVFAATTPAPAADLLPPQTSLVLGPTTVAGSTQATITVAVPVGFSATDPTYPGAPTSGVAQTYYLLDSPFVSTTSTPGAAWNGSFLLPVGVHSLSYYSVDNAGNYEPVNISTLTVTAPTRDYGGLGLASDASGRLWEVVESSGAVYFALNDSSGVPVSSAILPNADPAFPWSVVFDASGNPWAIGAATGTGGADLVAAYRASPSGPAIVSARTFDGASGNNNLVFASSGGWIVGAIQTSGPVDPNAAGARAYATAIWKLDYASGQISLATATSRAGFDVGTGLTVDGSGNLWISGYSENPNPLGPLVFDLALWEYAPDGKTPVAGPFYKTQFLSDFNTGDLALVVPNGTGVVVAAPRGLAESQLGLDFAAFGASGTVLADSSWLAGDGSDSYPGALLPTAGGFLVAGAVDNGDSTGSGLWRYSATGALTSVAQVAAPGARAAAPSNGNVWLAVDGQPSPYLDAGETHLGGGLADIEPPRSSVAGATVPVAGGTAYFGPPGLAALSAVDDAYAPGDGLGRGALSAQYSIDGSGFAPYSNPFPLVSEGTHTIRFFASDASGNTEAPNTVIVGYDATAPTPTLVALSTNTFAVTAVDPIVNGAASGVAQIGYLVDVSPSSCDGVTPSTSAAPGTCANHAYAGPFVLPPGNHTIYMQAVDNVGNGANVLTSSAVTVGAPVSLSVTAISPSSAAAGTTVSAAFVGTGFDSGATASLKLWSVVGGSWTATGAMNAGRQEAGAVSLLDGRVLIAGGFAANTYATLATAEIFDPATNSWTAAAPMSQPRFGFVLARLPDGRVLAAGGRQNGSTDISTAEIYDPAANSWTAAAPMAAAHTNGVFFTRPDGKVLVAGGYLGSGYQSSSELYDPASGTWSAGPAMSAGRAAAMGATLRDGRFLVAGGAGAPNLSSAEIYDPSSNAWTSAGSMSVGRFYGVMTGLSDGRALIVGGASLSAEIYDPATNAWTVAAPPASDPYAGTIFAVGAKAVVVGGAVSGSASTVPQVYDPATNSWSAGPTMTARRMYHTLTRLADGRWLAAGGSPDGGTPSATAETLSLPSTTIAAGATSVADSSHLSASFNLAGAAPGAYDAVVADGGKTAFLPGAFRVYSPDTTPPVTSLLILGGRQSPGPNPSSLYSSPDARFGLTAVDPSFGVGAGSWTAVAPLSAPRVAHAADALGGIVYAVGGLNGSALSSLAAYDPATNAWSTKAPMPTARLHLGAAALGGLLYAAGGQSSTDANQVVSALEAYDPGSNSWSSKAAMPTARTQVAAAAANGVLYVAGGYHAGVLNAFEAYDPSSNSWSSKPSLPTSRFLASAASLNGVVYVVGGSDASGNALTTVEAYDPSSNSWTTKAPLTTGRSRAALVSLGGFLYAIGGTNATGDLTSVEQYSPAANAWTSAGNLPSTLQTGAAAATATNAYLIGGQGPSGATSAVLAFAPASGSASGVASTRWSIDGGPFAVYAGTVAFAEGVHQLAYQSRDNAGNQEAVTTTTLLIDGTPPVASLSVGTPSVVAPDGTIWIAPTAPIRLTASDPVVVGSTVPGSGVASLLVAVDSAALAAYAPPLTIAAAGPHLVSFQAIDAVGNASTLSTAAVSVATAPFVAAVTPSSGPIGISATISGINFGAYNAAKDRVYLGASTAAVVSWNASTVAFSVPTLAAGVYPLTLAVLQNGATVPVSAGSFTVVAPQLFDVVPDSGPIGAIVTLDGAAFGAYAGARTQVVIGASTAPVNSWADAKIKATVPGALAPGDYPILARRIALDGGVSASNALNFHVDSLNLAGVNPSTGPAGVSFAISGSGFGSANGNLTQILFGGTTAQVSSWTDTKVVGVVPALSTGTYDLSLLRIQGTGVAASAVTSFTVTALTISAPSPAAAPLGELVTLSGTGFGAYGGTKTRLLIGGSTVPVTSWTDSTIKGRVPTLADGPQAVWIERLSGTGLESSNTAYLQVETPAIAAVTPSSGPIGGTVVLSGAGFGTLNGSSTTVLFGGTTAPITLWNDATVQITVPGDAPLGTASIQLRRAALDGGIVLSNAVSYGVAALAVGAVSPSSAPIGAPFVVTGSGFGAYAGTTNTQVLIGGATAAITAWSDATIKGTIPFLSTGTYGVVVQRQQGGFAEQSAVSSITIVLPTVYSLTPSSGPIGAPFTISGLTFGPSGGASTKVLFGGSTATVTSWTDSLVKGTVPGWASTGTYELTIERDASGGAIQIDAGPFLVVAPVVSTITPNFGNAGTVVTVRGAGFGPAAGASTRLFVGASTVAYSVWNDQTIKWTVPASLANGLYAVTVVRAPAGGTATSNAMNYTVGSIALGAFAAAKATPLAALPDQNFEGGMNLLASDGGVVQSASLAGVTVPAGALSDDAVVTVARDRDTAASARVDALGAAKLSAAGEPIAFGPEGTQFSVPATISLPYDPNLVPAGAVASLQVGYYDPIAKTWTPLTSQVDPINHVVTAQTAHFSLYQALVPAGLLGTAAQDAWGLRAAYAFPNPVRGTSSVTIRIQPGLADSVEVHVYDKAGRRVHASANFALSVTDDGNGLGAQDTYDHAWDISGVGSGVYDFVITAKRSGQSDIHKTGKIGVIK